VTAQTYTTRRWSRPVATGRRPVAGVSGCELTDGVSELQKDRDYVSVVKLGNGNDLPLQLHN